MVHAPRASNMSIQSLKFHLSSRFALGCDISAVERVAPDNMHNTPSRNRKIIMSLTKFAFAALLVSGFAAQTLFVSEVSAQSEPVDMEAVDLIKKEGLENSHVMNYMSWMTDVYGGRLTGSPALDRATEWAIETMQELGLENVHKEAWGPFGRGWTLEHMDIQARTEYGSFLVTAYPKAWSPGTAGQVSGEVIHVSATNSEELEKYRGQLSGKIILIQEMRELDEPFGPTAVRHDDENLLRMANAVPRVRGRGGRGRFQMSEERRAEFAFRAELNNLIISEEPLAILDRGSKGDYGTIFVSGASVPSPAGAAVRPRAWDMDAPETVPQLTLAVEHYNRIMRQLELGIEVNMDLNLQVAFNDDDPMEYNIIGEIPGTDPEVGDEVVMIGAHFDSWHAGTGATDNASGSSVMIEVMRIMKAVYAENGHGPRRTIRIALWTGEEQGLHGSRNYVNDHFAESAGRGRPPSKILPEHEKLSVYYNMDNGTGKIRGVYMQGNDKVAPIFRAWLAPFNSMGAATLTINNTGGTDHQSFDGVGLPGFQFIQEPIAYGSKTHHSNMDVYDHTIADDLMQAATIIASFTYHSAERDEMIPRKEMPAPASPGTN